MKLHYYILIITTSLPISIYSQKETNNWLFGFNSGLTFSSGSPVSFSAGTLYSVEGTTSASDPITGNLLFYSDGIKVWDATNTPMPNGTGLLGCHSSTMSALAVPQPGHPDIYYLFTTDCAEDSGALGFNYNIINMAANGGLGDVTSKNNLLFAPCGEMNHAVKHANCIDYWVVAREVHNNTYRAYLLTDTGITAPVITSIGHIPSIEYAPAGQGKFSPDGSKFAVADGEYGTVQLFDFNNATGVFSNPITLVPSTPFVYTYGLSFSPDNTKLYADVGLYPDTLFQWDVSSGVATTILASKTFITAFLDFAQLQIGPDFKIYMANASAPALSVINAPNATGLSCNFVAGAIALSGLSAIGLPAFPENYFNGLRPADFLTVNSTSICKGDTATLIAKGANTYTWSTLETTDSIRVSPVNTKTYKVVGLLGECIDTAVVTLIVNDCKEPPTIIEIPNVFTPNNDNQNDVFAIKNLQSGVADIVIYNRWGNIVYHSPNYNNDWQGQGLSDGVYYYILNYKPDEKTYEGFVELVR